MTMGLRIGRNIGHVNTATGRNKREVGQMAKRDRRAEQGGSFTVAAPRRQNGRITGVARPVPPPPAHGG